MKIKKKLIKHKISTKQMTKKTNEKQAQVRLGLKWISMCVWAALIFFYEEVDDPSSTPKFVGKKIC